MWRQTLTSCSLPQNQNILTGQKIIGRGVYNRQRNASERLCVNISSSHMQYSGCDTTSRLFGLGKGIAVNKLKNDATFRQTAKIFSRTGQTRDTIIGSGEKAIVLLYGGKHGDGLDAFRYQRCSDKVLNGAVLVEPQSLPPSSAAAKYHSFPNNHPLRHKHTP